ncbi:hypothetical protein [Sulfurimonas autotrophica]|uniref:Uncharacterized protein n=1 Tax=Sulfurimonas autotrophica (strain ATCC BAA-671 / DSM 16294 / JCM 11897 / OK10) TaxID=563040 RepID=E0UQW9_SULAO|nr:hypothetical protein [Sulfurimonas autotrophica]ADN08850.1 hypothetical protein Saut_0801 [Sulfurimonas autotrophica DSM 16294]
MEEFITITFTLMDKMIFSPLILIGLLITTLSLVINLKDNNHSNIKKFKKHKNIYIFIDRIFYTASILVILFLLSLFTEYIHDNEFYVKISVSILYITGLVYVAYSLFVIVYILQEIAKTSLKNNT